MGQINLRERYKMLFIWEQAYRKFKRVSISKKQSTTHLGFSHDSLE